MQLMLRFLAKLAVTNLTGLLECHRKITFQSPSGFCIPFLRTFCGIFVQKNLKLKHVNHTFKKQPLKISFSAISAGLKYIHLPSLTFLPSPFFFFRSRAWPSYVFESECTCTVRLEERTTVAGHSLLESELRCPRRVLSSAEIDWSQG